MKKQTLILAAGLTLASLLLSGCGNEAKFNTAKDNFLKYYAEFANESLNSTSPCVKFHKPFKKEYEIMLKADKELTLLTKLAESDSECKAKLQNNWKEIEEFKLQKSLLKQAAEYHKKQYKCDLGGIKIIN